MTDPEPVGFGPPNLPPCTCQRPMGTRRFGHSPECPMLVDWQQRRTDALEPVGLAEIASRLGVQRQTVDAWRVRRLLPSPRWTVGGRPAWDWATISSWAQETGRLPDRAEG